MNLQFKISALLSFDSQIFSQKFDNGLKFIDDRYFFLHVLKLISLWLNRDFLLLESFHLGLQSHNYFLELITLSRDSL